MRQYTIKQEVMITEIQANSLKILRSKGINTFQFIRQAIKEKLQRDGMKLKKEMSVKSLMLLIGCMMIKLIHLTLSRTKINSK